MTGPDTGVPWEFLQSASRTSLMEFEQKRLAEASMFRKEVKEVLEQWLNAAVDATVTRLLIETDRLRSIAACPTQYGFDFGSGEESLDDAELLGTQPAAPISRKGQERQANRAA